MQTLSKDKENTAICPLITFVIPCYNVDVVLLKECINSIVALQMDVNEREIIIVDDGSDIPVESLGYQAIVVRKENGGVGSARNKALAMARGKYVQFVDADDLLIPDVYSEVLLPILRSTNPSVVAFDFVEKEKSNKLNSKPHSVVYSTASELMRSRNINSSVWTYIFSLEAIGNLRFAEDLTYAEDDLFVSLFMLQADKAIRNNCRAYFYRSRKESAIAQSRNTRRQQRLNDVLKVIDRLVDYSRQSHRQNSDAINRRIAQLAMNYLYLSAVLMRSVKSLLRSKRELRKRSLYPLPLKSYTYKYLIAALATRLF